MSDPLAITPLHPCLGARVEGVDLARPTVEPPLARRTPVWDGIVAAGIGV